MVHAQLMKAVFDSQQIMLDARSSRLRTLLIVFRIVDLLDS